MALFNRKKKDAVLPEIDKYYEGERRDRNGLAWLLAMVSVILVTLLIIGLFLLGRWIYRELTDDNGGDTATVQQENGENVPSFDGEAPGADEDGANDGTTDDPDMTTGDSDQSGDEDVANGDDSADENGSVDAPVSTNTPSDPSTQVPATGDDPLPSTGSASTAAIFMGVSTLAGGVHYTVQRKRTK